MIHGKLLRRAGIFTLVLFCWFYLIPNFSFAQEEDELLRARKLYQQGYYDDAITLLNQCINKLKSIVEQKRNVAEAFYLLAKVYFTVGEDDKVTENLNKLFETYPGFEKEETDLEFKDRVDKTRAKFLAQPEETPLPPEGEQQEEVPQTVVQPEPQPAEEADQQVIEKPEKKKKKKFPILLVLGGLVVAGVAAYFLLVKKSEDEGYDIRGSWSMNFNWYLSEATPPGTATITFTGGSKNSGTFYTQSYTGTWTVTGNQIRFVFQSGTTYIGTIASDTYMSGTMVDYNGNPGSWSATRISGKAKAAQDTPAISPNEAVAGNR